LQFGRKLERFLAGNILDFCGAFAPEKANHQACQQGRCRAYRHPFSPDPVNACVQSTRMRKHKPCLARRKRSRRFSCGVLGLEKHRRLIVRIILSRLIGALAVPARTVVAKPHRRLASRRRQPPCRSEAVTDIFVLARGNQERAHRCGRTNRGLTSPARLAGELD
jgi:hypothetical protein